MPKKWKINFWFALVLFILYGTVIWEIVDGVQKQAEARRYAAAPGCTAGSPVSGSGPSCRTTKVTIRKKEFFAGDDDPDTYFLDTVESNGTNHRTRVGPICYNHTVEGQSVAVQVWNGYISLFLFPDRSFQTGDNPSALAEPVPRRYGLILFLGGGGTIFFVWYWKSSRREALAERTKSPKKSP